MDRDNFKDPFDRWIKITDALWKEVDDDPSLAPAIYFWTIGKHMRTANTTGKKNFSTTSSRLSREVKRFKERFLGVWSSEPEEKCDVLFVSNSTRSNLLGACIKAAEALQEDAAGIKTGFVMPEEISHTYQKQGKHNSFSLYRLNKGYVITFSLIIKSFRILGHIRKSVRQDKQLKSWFAEENVLKRWRKIMSSLISVHYARRWLRKVGARLIITPSEQWPPGSTLIAAARMEGISTCQILHGMPARIYWPFLSDELWVWGPKTRQVFLEYGAPVNRLKTIGSLEFAGELPQSRKPHTAFKTFLFLSQWHGRENLGEGAYTEILNWIGTILAEQKTKWRLTIRWHPHDGESGLKFHEGLFSKYGVVVHYSKGNTSLRDDVLEADFVCTQSSSAILMSLILKIPCALLWTRDHYRILGEPFLDPPFLATNSKELEKLLSCTVYDKDYRKSIQDLIGDPVETHGKTSKRIMEILSCQNHES